MKAQGPSRLDEFGDQGTERASATESFRDSLRQFGQIRDFVSYYFAAKWDGVRANFRGAILKVAVGAIGLLVAAGILVTAGVLLMTGLADGLSRLMGTGPWAGNLLAGAIALAVAGGAVAVGLSVLRRRWHQQLEHKYDERKLQQRIHHGKDVREYATEEDAPHRLD